MDIFYCSEVAWWLEICNQITQNWDSHKETLVNPNITENILSLFYPKKWQYPPIKVHGDSSKRTIILTGKCIHYLFQGTVWAFYWRKWEYPQKKFNQESQHSSYNHHHHLYSAQRPVLAGTRAQSGDQYGSGTLHSRQFIRGRLPLLSPAFRRSHFRL